MSLRRQFPAPWGKPSVSAPECAGRRPDSRAGFSLIELLTVIAIIAILAAVIFPIAGTVRVRAQQTQVISNLHAVHAALNLYKLDEHGYPQNLGPLIIGGGSTTTQFGGLYPEHLKDRKTYYSPANDTQNPDATLLIDGQLSQKYGAYADYSNLAKTFGNTEAPLAGGSMYAWDTMDGSPMGDKYVMHYSRYRTLDKNDPDYKRQLGFRNPPEDTVVTWNDTFVNYSGANAKGDYLVLFLNGDVKKFSADAVEKVNGQVWRLRP